MKSIKSPARRAYLQIIVFALFQKKLPANEDFAGVEKSREETPDFSRLRCPHCKWQPTAASRWCCADADFPEFYFNGCGALWNTFATGGVCVGCAHRWRWTTCLRCAEWSRHADWYAEKRDV